MNGYQVTITIQSDNSSMIILFLIPVPHRQLHVRCTPYEYTIWVTIVFLPTLCTLVERPSSPTTMAVCAYRIRAVSHRFLSQKCMVLLHHTLQADFDFALFTISPPLKDSKLFSNAIVHPYIIVLTMYDCIYAPLKYMYQYMFLLCWHAQSFFYQNSKDIKRKKKSHKYLTLYSSCYGAVYWARPRRFWPDFSLDFDMKQ